MSIAAAILAGGLARRMAGANKATLQIGASRIIDRQIALLRQVADPVFIVSGHPAPFRDLALTVVDDVVSGAGSLGGIYSAIVSSPHARTIVVACDMPFLTLPLLQRLARPSDADLVIPRSVRGYEPLCAAWGATCAEPIRRRIDRGILKAAWLVEELRVEEIGPEVLASCDPHGLLFVNVNTAHDYERAQELSRLESKPSQDRIMDISGPGPKPA
ncbi:MAG: molybdenum cofactor guanylyltransferase [Vicinamibacterales bacterium]